MITSKEAEVIFSSTGKLGVSRRQYGRIYVNGTRYSADPIEVEQNFRRLTAIGEKHQHKIGRSIFRGLVNEAVMQHILDNDLRSCLEVVLPVAEFTGDSSWLVYLARNRSERGLIVSREVMADVISKQKKEIIPPLERVQSTLERGYTFTDRISEDQVSQVYALWGDTFGWQYQEIDNLRRRLGVNRCKDPSERDVWFTAIKDNGTILSIAMAERLSIPTAYGQLDLVESTEWRTRDEYAGNGLMTATVAVLNAQILSDFQDNTNGLPLIYAECNFQSRSDRVGHGARFLIPEQVNAAQILTQNVRVRDGQPLEDTKLRDFTFMYLPIEAIRMYYNPMQTEAIVQLVT